MTAKKIAWELLNKYRQAEMTIISEYSIDEATDIEKLEKECESYRERIEEEPDIDWIPFRLREMTAEEQEEHRDEKFMWDDPMPDDGQKILVSDGWHVWEDTFMDDGDICYLENNDDIYEGMAWMALPKPHKKEVKE